MTREKKDLLLIS